MSMQNYRNDRADTVPNPGEPPSPAQQFAAVAAAQGIDLTRSTAHALTEHLGVDDQMAAP
jgi:hypothetical protein